MIDRIIVNGGHTLWMRGRWCEIPEYLKGLEHRKIGWKILILKYDFGKSLSKEMWHKITDTKTFIDYKFKKMKKYQACWTNIMNIISLG